MAEVHDATSFGELFMTELLGFCELGDGGHFAASGAVQENGGGLLGVEEGAAVVTVLSR